MCGVAYLIKVEYESDERGVRKPVETKREIFIFEKSITRSEWSSAGRDGLNPAICLSTPRCNYDGEEFVEYNGIKYKIYRTYAIYDDIELYLEKRGGVYDQED